MLRYLGLILLFASFTLHAATSLRVGNKVLTVGDSAAYVLQLMGPPTLRTLVPDRHGGFPGNVPDNQLLLREEWQYAQDGKTIVITMVGGRATQFETLYH